MLAHARSHTTRGRDVEDSALGRAVSLARGARALAADGNAASLPDDGSATLRRRAATDDFTPGHSLPLRGARSTPSHFGTTGVGATRRRRRRRRRARPPLFLGCGGGGTREAGGTKGTSHIGGTKGAALSSRYVMVIYYYYYKARVERRGQSPEFRTFGAGPPWGFVNQGGYGDSKNIVG